MRIIETNWFLPKRFAAVTVGCILFIRPEAATDKVLLAHEKVHCEQFQRDWLMPVKYLLFKEYRFECELEAYRASVKNGRSVESCADSLYKKYGLSKNYRAIIQALLFEEQ